jgi:hypothetical protein
MKQPQFIQTRRSQGLPPLNRPKGKLRLPSDPHRTLVNCTICAICAVGILLATLIVALAVIIRHIMTP